MASASGGEGSVTTKSRQLDVRCQFSEWIGKLVDKEATKNRPYRIYTQGDPITEDFVPARLNLILDEDEIVIKT